MRLIGGKHTHPACLLRRHRGLNEEDDDETQDTSLLRTRGHSKEQSQGEREAAITTPKPCQTTIPNLTHASQMQTCRHDRRTVGLCYIVAAVTRQPSRAGKAGGRPEEHCSLGERRHEGTTREIEQTKSGLT